MGHHWVIIAGVLAPAVGRSRYRYGAALREQTVEPTIPGMASAGSHCLKPRSARQALALARARTRVLAPAPVQAQARRSVYVSSLQSQVNARMGGWDHHWLRPVGTGSAWAWIRSLGLRLRLRLWLWLGLGRGLQQRGVSGCAACTVRVSSGPMRGLASGQRGRPWSHPRFTAGSGHSSRLMVPPGHARRLPSAYDYIVIITTIL